MAVARERVRLSAAGGSDLAAVLPVLLFVVAFAALPALVLFVSGWVAAGGLAGFSAVVTDPLSVSAIENSFVQGAASAGLAVAVGFPAGVFLGRYVGPGRTALLALFLVPFLLPVLVMVGGLQALFGPTGFLTGDLPAFGSLGSGLSGVVTVNVLFNAPIVVLLTAVGVESASDELEATVATLGGGPARRFRDVWGRGAALGAAAGALIAFLYSALAFAAPLIVCGAKCYTVEVRIWALDQELAQPASASMLGIALVLMFALPAFLYLVLAGRLHRSTRPLSARFDSFGPRPIRVALAGWTVGVLVIEMAVALSVLLASFRPPGASGFTLVGWQELFGTRVTAELGLSTGAAIGNSLFFAGACAALAIVLGILSGFWIRRRAGRSLALRLLLLLPLLLSPVLLAFALESAWGDLLGGPSNVWLLIVLSQTTIALPFVIPTLLLALRSLPPAPRESAELLGARPFTAFVETELPAVRGALLTAALLAFVIGLGEFTATFFLATPAFTTVPVEFYRLQALRAPAVTAACGALLLILSATALLAIAWGGRRVVV